MGIKPFFPFLFLFCTTPNLYAQPNLDQLLVKGKYSVGFYSTVYFDVTQNYPFYLDSTSPVQKAPKPLVMQVWYPANVKVYARPMQHREYTMFHSKNAQLSKWMTKLSNYNNEAIVKEVFRKDTKELDSLENGILDSFMRSPTNVFKDSKPINQRFPFVIYAQGSGGTVEENAVFCALLASHGYVVIGSSFQYNEAGYLGPSGPPRSVRDIAAVLSFANKLPNVDYNRAGMVGHSLGAQKMLHFMAQGATPFDALISLETTQEYHTEKNKLWSYFTEDVIRNKFEIAGNFLFAADASAIHVLADQMHRANRYYLATPSIAHNDYISQGIQRKYILWQKTKDLKTKEKYMLARDNYAQLCNYMIQFMNAKLRKDSLPWENAVRNLNTKKEAGFYIETMPPGQFTVIYNVREQKIPTPRELKFMMMNNRVDSVILFLNKYWIKDTKLPIYDPTFIYPMLDYLLEKDTVQAVKLYQAYIRLIGDEAINQKFISWSKFFSANLMKEDAKASLNALYILNPNDKERIRQLIEKQEK